MPSGERGVLLDTHTWVWALRDPSRIGGRAREALRAASAVYLSPISVWEVLVLARKGRLTLSPSPAEWVDNALRRTPAMCIPLDHHIAARSELLSGFERADPGDRFIVATAVEHDLTLLTADAWILAWPGVRTVW